MKAPMIAIALFGFQINLADPLTFNQDRPLCTFENFYVSQIYQPTMNPSLLGPRIVETRQIRRSSTRPRTVCPEDTGSTVPTIATSVQNKIVFTFINDTDIPVSAHIYIDHLKDNIGYFGYALDAHSKKTLGMKELYWFPYAATGYKIAERFQVLNHALPNKLTIVIPNQKNKTFDIAQGNYTINLSADAENHVIVKVSKK